MNWINLNDISQLNLIDEQSKQEPVILFKHSTRCPVSSMAMNRLETAPDFEQDIYLLDLIAYRDISNEIERRYNVAHESPQVLIVKDGKPVFDTSHNMIRASVIQDNL